MNFWRKLLGVKESPKIEIAEWKPTQPCTTSDPQPPSIQPMPATQLQGTSPQALPLAAQDQSASFHEAVKGGDLEKVQTLLEDNPNLVFSADNPNGYTPLHCAALKGQKDVAALLLASKAVVNAKDSCARTPLHWAAMKGQKDVAELLLANQAEVNAKEAFGKMPLHLAAQYGDKNVAALLLAGNAAVNAKDNTGRTPLH
jgi:ankyrin repeat protein